MCMQISSFDVLDDNTMLAHGDCLEKMKLIPDNSIDMVLTDPPYGTTACKWDTVIPFESMWEELKRITKDNGAICLFGSEPFSSALRMSNIKMFKYDWIWHKTIASNFAAAKKQPLNRNENISVFYKRAPFYQPQMLKGEPYYRTPSKKRSGKTFHTFGKTEIKNNGERYPDRFLKFSNNNRNRLHPTQKPVALLEYLIKTYTLENETVLDFTMGSGSTGVACKNLKRKFIGIEQDDKYYNIAIERICNEL